VPDHDNLTLKEIWNWVAAIDAEVGGAPRLEVRDPNRRPLKERLHALENDRATAQAAHAATEALKEVQRRGWGTAHTIALTLFAACSLTIGILGLVLN